MDYRTTEERIEDKAKLWHIDFDRMRLTADLIQKGVRSAGHITIHKESKDKMAELLTESGWSHSIKDCGEHHCDLLMCRYPYLLKVADAIEASPEPLRTWALGKLYGYSDVEIELYIRQQEESR